MGYIIEFNTQEWADTYKDFLNGNPNYKKSAESWEGALVLRFEAENIRLNKDVYLYLDIYHGECRNAKFYGLNDDIEYEYLIEAPESSWSDILSGKMEETRALMSGKFKIKGNVSKLMRFPKAAAYIIKYLRRLLADWQ